MSTRDIMLLIFGTGWLIVLVITAVRGPVPADLWATLALGLGGIMAAFKTNDYVTKRQDEGRKTKREPEPVEDTES